MTLLLCIVITNVPLRSGMWSLVVIITVVMLSIIFGPGRHWWEWIFTKLSLLDIRINMGGYLFISIGLFTIWLITAAALRPAGVHIVFTPGQFNVCTEIGGGGAKCVYDTNDMKLGTAALATCSGRAGDPRAGFGGI